MEGNLLSRLRDGEIALTPEVTTALLQMVVAIRQMLQSIDSTGSEGERSDEVLVQTLTGRRDGGEIGGKPSENAAQKASETTQGQQVGRGSAADSAIRVVVGLLDKLKIPLTLAIIPALIVTNRGEGYSIPQISLLELVRLEGEEAQKLTWFKDYRCIGYAGNCCRW